MLKLTKMNRTNKISNGVDDLFIKIVQGEIPAHKVYEDDATVAFLDINPHNKGHALVVSKEKYRNIFDVPEETLCSMMQTAKKLAKAVKESVGADGINIGMNNEKAAGQEIFHVHIHVIPRFENDGVYKKAKHIKYKDGEIETVAEQIRKELAH